MKKGRVVQALKVRWNKFYSYLSSDEQFRDTIRKYLEMSEDDRYNYFSNGKRNTNNNNHVMKASQKFAAEKGH
ncbi:MAG TPA: hypothetical protein VE619_04165 [Nitrososphaeraceae archaeon]|nr:hypothetical protein [Nitrososphaeraceae archaeon]